VGSIGVGSIGVGSFGLSSLCCVLIIAVGSTGVAGCAFGAALDLVALDTGLANAALTFEGADADSAGCLEVLTFSAVLVFVAFSEV